MLGTYESIIELTYSSGGSSIVQNKLHGRKRFDPSHMVFFERDGQTHLVIQQAPYETAYVLDVELRRALIDSDSLLNIMYLLMLEAAGSLETGYSSNRLKCQDSEVVPHSLLAISTSTWLLAYATSHSISCH